jgi:glycogen debranching enzyme
MVADVADYDADLDAWLCRKAGESWSLVLGALGARSIARASGHDLWGPERCGRHGVSVSLTYDLSLVADEPASLDLVIAGSEEGSEAVMEAFERARSAFPALWEAKAVRYAGMLDQSVLRLPDPGIERAWDWIKCNYDWLVRDVPGRGRGLGAGVEDYPWWFGCDNAYALLGCLALGQHEIALATLDLLREISLEANGPCGRVVHECTTARQVADAGRANETPQFVSTVWQAALWTGDRAFLERNYDFCKRGLLQWTLRDHTPEGDLLPSGYGMIEIEGLDRQCVDVAAYTVSALLALADMAEVMGDEETHRICLQRAEAMRNRLEQAFWIEDEGLYGDVLATPHDIVGTVEQWLARPEGLGSSPALIRSLQRILEPARQEPEPERKRPWLFKNWTVICPLETGIAQQERALRVLDRVGSPEFTGPWGMYINALAGVDAMSINTGALTMAELRYGRVDRAVDLIRTITASLDCHMPGAISEISPDRGCFVQAWSGYGVAWPIVSGIFGLRPDAFRRRLVISPQFPGSWPAADIRNVRIGNTCCDMVWDGTAVRVEVRDAGWEVLVQDQRSAAGSNPRLEAGTA